MKEQTMSELTADLIVDQQFPQDVQIAPDGKQVAKKRSMRPAPSG
jgi:hypothetical protein